MTSSSRHYLYDPTADMLYNPWLGSKIAWPEKEERRGKRSREFSRQFMDQHVNRELLVIDTGCYPVVKFFFTHNDVNLAGAG